MVLYVSDRSIWCFMLVIALYGALC